MQKNRVFVTRVHKGLVAVGVRLRGQVCDPKVGAHIRAPMPYIAAHESGD